MKCCGLLLPLALALAPRLLLAGDLAAPAPLPLADSPALAGAAAWPEWRGPGAQGHSASTHLALQWSETGPLTWRCPLPGRGWSSPVLASGLAWMTTAMETPASPEESARRLQGNTGDQPLNLLAKVELRALGVDIATGKLLHNVLLLEKREPQWVHQLNSYASPSPVYADGRLYCHFGTLGTACLDTANQKVVWTNQSPELEIMHENGPGSSPVVVDDRVIFHLDGSDRQSVAALDAATGKILWQTPRSGPMHDNPQYKKSYGTPLLITAQGRRQLISTGSDWLYSYDPSNGTELWKLSYGDLGFSITPRPVFGEGWLYLATGYGKSRVLAVNLEAKPEIAWNVDKGAPTMSSPLLAGGLLYFVNDGGMLSCVDARTGEEVYRERLGEPCSASPLAAPGRIYIPGREGRTFVIKSCRHFELLATNHLDGQQFASFAVAGDSLFIRTDQALYRLPPQ